MAFFHTSKSRYDVDVNLISNPPAISKLETRNSKLKGIGYIIYFMSYI
jgi:hypothetical protein